jgi:hypothetical protein
MPLLVPGVGEEDVHAGQRAGRDHVTQHLDRVVADEPQVVEVLFLDAHQQGADARRMHLAGDEVALRQRRGDRRRALAHAEADLEDRRRLAAEQRRHVERLGAVGEQQARPELGQRA